MSRFYEAMTPIVEYYGGSVEKFVGDAIKATFGAPTAHEDDALRAVIAAVDMRAALQELNAELHDNWQVEIATRTGINTGLVVVGRTSGPALGDAVNVTARLEQAAAPGEILLGESTYRLVADAVEAERLSLAVKGKQHDVVAYRLRHVFRQSPGARRRLDAQFVAREDELRTVQEVFAETTQRQQPRLVLVSGDPGIGKSRLLLEIRRSCTPSGAVWVQQSCLPYGQAAFAPVSAIVREIAGIADEDPTGVAAQKLHVLLDGTDQGAVIVERLMGMLGLGGSTTEVDELFWAVRRLFERLGQKRPLVVAIEDLHWGQPTLIELIEHISDWARETALTVVCSARPEFMDRHPGWIKSAALIQLGPLDQHTSWTLMANRLGTLEGVEHALADVSAKAGGNPLFIEQLLSMMIDEGIIAQGDGRWEAKTDFGALGIPPSLQALLAARLDALPVDQREVLGAAAVAGTDFSTGALAHLLPQLSTRQLHSITKELIARDLLEAWQWDLPDQSTLAFRHVLVRDAAYASLPLHERLRFHEALVTWLEKRGAPAETLGYHLEQAFNSARTAGGLGIPIRDLGRRAAEFLFEAGRLAYRVHDANAAADLLWRSLDLSEQTGSVRFECLAKLGNALVVRGEMQQLGELIDRVDRFDMPEDQRFAAEASALRAYRNVIVGSDTPISEALRTAEQSLVVFERVGDLEGVARTLAEIAYFHEASGDESQCLHAARRVLQIGSQGSDSFEEGWARETVAGSVWRGRAPLRHALEEARRFLAWAESGGSKVFVSVALGLVARAEAALGEGADARGHLQAAKDVREGWGLHPGPLGFVAFDVAMSTDVSEAEQDLRVSYSAFEDRGQVSLLASIAPRLALVEAQQGALEEAEALVKVSESTAADDDLDAQFWIALAQTHIALGHDMWEVAETQARRALSLVEPTDWISLQAEANFLLASVLADSGRHPEALPPANRAYNVFRSKGHVVGMTKVEELLDRLAGGRARGR